MFSARVCITHRRDLSGRPMGFLLISKDISDEIRLTQYARSLIEASVDPLVTISPEGKITDVNEATVKVNRETRQMNFGHTCTTYSVYSLKKHEGYQRVFSQGFVTDHPLTIRYCDARQTDVLYNASVYKNARFFFNDTATAEIYTLSLHDALPISRSLIEASVDPLVTISPEGKITDVNEATVK